MKDNGYSLVLEFFGHDLEKTRRWWITPNPMLGQISPHHMLMMGNGRKLEQFIIDATQENKMVNLG